MVDDLPELRKIITRTDKLKQQSNTDERSKTKQSSFACCSTTECTVYNPFVIYDVHFGVFFFFLF